MYSAIVALDIREKIKEGFSHFMARLHNINMMVGYSCIYMELYNGESCHEKQESLLQLR